MNIRKLPEIIKKNGFVYRLVKRNDQKAIYAQENLMGKVQTYEVFFHRLQDSKKSAEAFSKLTGKAPVQNDCDFHEIFPGNEEFGKRAWSYPQLQQAMLAFDTK